MRVSFIDMTMDFHKICRSGNLKGEFQKTVTCELLSRVFLPPLTSLEIFILKPAGNVAVAAVLGILAWIGNTSATPPFKPLEEIERGRKEYRSKRRKTSNR